MSLENQTPTSPEPSAEESLALEVADIFGIEQPSIETAEPPAASPSAAPPAPVEGAAPVEAPAAAPEPSPAPVAPEPAPAPASSTPAPSPAPTTPPATPTPAPDPRDLQLASLTATVQSLQAALEQQRANQPGGQPSAAEPGQGTPQAPQLPQYALTLPPQVEEALSSEDPTVFRAGVLNIINNLAAIVHHNVRTEFNHRLATFQQERQNDEVVTRQAQEREAQKEQYYSLFPGHKNPTIEPIIQQQAGKLATEYPGLSWGPEFMNALGARVNNALTELTGAAPAPAPAPFTPQPSVPARPAPGLPTGTRGEVPGSELSGSDLIEDTFR